MNKLVKVYSHRRSGTNFLCGLLYVNYYNGIDMRSDTEREIKGRYFQTLEGEKVRYNQWAGLFGSHSPIPPHDLFISNSIYMRRDPVDTAYSLYRRADLDMTFKEYLDEKFKGKTIIEHIEEHHRNWEQTKIYIVDYEDLYKYLFSTMEKIEKRFDLKRLNPEIQTIGKVGWNPGKGIPGEGRRVLNENS